MKPNIASLAGCFWIDLPQISDLRGNLSVAESSKNIPFDIRRIYYIYDIPVNETRASHAHRELIQVFIAISGSFDIMLDDGNQQMTYRLDQPHRGLYVCPMIWHEVKNFSDGSVCLSIASDHYDEADYYRNYEDFLNSTL